MMRTLHTTEPNGEEFFHDTEGLFFCETRKKIRHGNNCGIGKSFVNLQKTKRNILEYDTDRRKLHKV